MKSVVLNDTGRQIEFKPNVTFEEYCALLERDAKHELKNKKLFSSSCPACLSKKKMKTFKKFGFQYVECQTCNTIYMDPHPNDEDIKDFYQNTDSGHFWREEISVITSNARREKIYSPRMQWMTDVLEEYFPQAKNIADLCNKNKGHVTSFINNPSFENKIIINPYFDVESEIDGHNDVQIINNYKDVEKETIDIVSAYEVIDYTSDVEGLFNVIKNILVPGGLCLITTLSMSGFDLQALWGNSLSIIPLDRINVLSKKGLNLLFNRHGFEIIEYSTPGLLDTDIVKNAIEKDKELPVSRFIKTLIDEGDEQLYKDFQNFLQINRLSSFTRILLGKN